MSKLISQEEWNSWYNKVYGYFFRRVDNKFDVEDLTAQTLNDFFLKESIDNPNGLMWVIARNKLTDYIRSKPKNQTIDLESLPESLIAKNTDVYTSYYTERLEHLKDCVKKNLNEQDYQIVELCTMYDFSSEMVADKLNLQAPNVRQKLSRSLKKVREICRNIWNTASSH